MSLNKLNLEEEALEDKVRLISKKDLKKSKKEDLKKKKKPFWDKVFNKNKLKKPKKVAILYLRNNGVATPYILESRKGFFNIEGKTYHEDRDCVYTVKQGYEKYPLAIIPEWSLVPYGTKKWHDKSMLEKFATLQDHVMKGIRHAERVRMGEKDEKKLNAKAAIGIAIAITIVIAVLMGYK